MGMPSWGFANGHGQRLAFPAHRRPGGLLFPNRSGRCGVQHRHQRRPDLHHRRERIARGQRHDHEHRACIRKTPPRRSSPRRIAGYAFVNWTENGTVVSTNPNYTFTVTGDRTLVANFAAGSLITTTSSPLNRRHHGWRRQFREWQQRHRRGACRRRTTPSSTGRRTACR